MNTWFPIRRAGPGLRIVILIALAVLLNACRPAAETAISAPSAGGDATGAAPMPIAVPKPLPTQSVVFADPDPATYVKLAARSPETLDPALAYDPASADALQNIYEGLITSDRSDPNTFRPALAEVVPTIDNGGLSADGLTYTFTVRNGVTFHEGGTLQAHDVAYSIRRQLLQSDPTGPAWLFLEPLLGLDDVTQEMANGAYVGDPEGLRANATADELAAICIRVMDAVAFDDYDRTVTLTLNAPWAPFLATLTGLGVLDQEWAVAQGAWDGSCGTWAYYYAPGSEGSELAKTTNGTGPYRLERLTPDDSFILSAFPDYWRTAETPLWPNGPWGAARIPSVMVEAVPEWGARLAALSAGDADDVSVPYENEAQLDRLVGEWCDYVTGSCRTDPDNPTGRLRKWDALPTVARNDIFMNQAVAADSPYLGQGRLNGNGIPPNFFADKDVRQAMAVCFDYDTFNADVLGGEGVRNNGPIITGMLGYNPDGPQYDYDPEACAAHLATAWGGVLPETGFRLSYVYPAPIPGGSQAGAVLKGALAAINEKYVVELVAVPPSAFFPGLFAGQYPLFYSGWTEDIHDPHNWAAPYTVGTYGATLGLPDALSEQFAALVGAGAAATDPLARRQIYFELQQLFYDEVPAVILFQRPGFRYEPRYIKGFNYRVGMDADNPPYYTLSIEQ